MLAWYLVPEEFGLVAIAMSIATFTGLLQFGGAREFLIQRGQGARRWLPIAKGYCLFLGGISLILSAGIAHLLTDVYAEPSLVSITLIQAVANALNSYGLVLGVRFQVEMRYGVLVGSGALYSVVSAVASIIFASLGLGAGSIPLALCFAALSRALVFATLGHKTRLHWRYTHWKYFFQTSAYTFGASICGAVPTHLAATILGLAASTAQAGLYFFSYNLSAQILQLLAVNIGQILFPALSNIRSSGGDHALFYKRVVSIMAFVSTPFCVIQAALSGLLVQYLFDENWADSKSIILVLSLGMVPQSISLAYASRMQSLQQWKMLFWTSLINSCAFVVVFSLGAKISGALGAACAATALAWCISPFNMLKTIGRKPGELRWLINLYLRPALIVLAMLCAHRLIGFGSSRLSFGTPVQKEIFGACVIVVTILISTGLLYRAEMRFLIRIIRERSIRILESFPL